MNQKEQSRVAADSGAKVDMPTNRKTLRRFGLTMAVVLGAIATVLVLRDRPVWPYPMGLALSFALFALVYPAALAPVERAWMALGRVMSMVVTAIVLVVTYYLVVTPVGLAMRILRKDPMKRKFDSKVESYWVPVDPEGSASRHDKPF